MTSTKYDLEAVRAAARRAWRKDHHRGPTLRSDSGRWVESMWHEYAHAVGLPHRCVLPATCPNPDWAIPTATARQLWAVGRRLYGSVRCDLYSPSLYFHDIRGVIATVAVSNRRIGVWEDYIDHDCGHWWSGRSWSLEWADPDMGEKLADAISQCSSRWGLEPFPADWMEAEVQCC